jgi:hypothetical protein
MNIRTGFARKLFAALLGLASLATTATAQAALVGYWNFSEGAGTVAADSSGNGFNGTLKSNATATAPTWALGAGASGDANDHAIMFNGGPIYTGSQVDLGNPTLLQLTGSRTQSFWLNGPLPASGRLTVLGKSYDQEGLIHVYSNGSLILYHGDDSNPNNSNNGNNFSTVSSAANSVTANTWTHVLYTRDTVAQTQEFYINGVGQGVQAWTARNPNTVSNAPWRIGTGYGGSYIGMMDDVAFWDEQLTDGEAASVYRIDAQVDSAVRALGYTVKQLDEMWTIYDGGTGSSGSVMGDTWDYITGVDISGRQLGESWLTGSPEQGYHAFLLLDLNGGSGVTSLAIAAVPEPSSLCLMSLLGVWGLVKLKKRCLVRS